MHYLTAKGQQAHTPAKPRRTTMKVETFLLKTFFVAAVLTCVLTMGAMVTTDASHVAMQTIASAQ
jgi:hypothetical protein